MGKPGRIAHVAYQKRLAKPACSVLISPDLHLSGERQRKLLWRPLRLPALAPAALPPAGLGSLPAFVATQIQRHRSWSWHLLPEQPAFLAGLGQAQQRRQRDRKTFFFFFLIYFSPLIYKAFGSFLMPRGISGEVPGEGRLWAATWQRFSRPARALLRTWFQF